MTTPQIAPHPQGKWPLCIWAQAGVGGRKFCKLDYACTACRYDQILQRLADENRRMRSKGLKLEGRRGQIVSWKDKLRELPPTQQPCLHHMKGRIEFRACTNNYSCPNCEFDQYFDDQFAVHITVKPVDLLDIAGFKIPQGYYLHHGHTWVKIEEANTVRIGLDEFALRVLGPFDRFQAPLVGKTLNQGHRDIRLQRSEHTAHLLSPVSGVVTAANFGLMETGHMAREDVYAQGWIVKAHTENLRRDLSQLMMGEQVPDFLAEEIHRLYDLIEETAGPLAADGGQLGSNIYGQLPQLGWKKLTRTFLRT